MERTTSRNVIFYQEFNSSWCAVKFSSSEEIHIHKMWINTSFAIKNTRNDFWSFILFNENKTVFDTGGTGVKVENYSDFFLHVNFFLLNFTLEYLPQGNISGWWGYPRYDFTLPRGSYYLVAFHPGGTYTNFTIWMNVAPPVEFINTSQGNQTYLLDETDFLGTLNVYSFNHSLMWKGSKKIHVDNTLVGSIYCDGRIGTTALKIVPPSGAPSRMVIVDGPHKSSVFGDNEFLFAERYIIPMGANGEWRFEISRLESFERPDIIFLYADVILP